ncbi:MAG: RNA polymerase sigma factor [Bacteroidetes bacterium]|nr:RNA polymerase sigma factor [Bacteroidota bacterium]
MDLGHQDILHTIIKGCINGDRKSQKELYKLYYSKMMNVCFRYAKNADDAQDLLQDGFVKVFSHLKSYDFKGSFEGWIRKIMVNTAIDFYRKNKGIYFIEDEDNFILETTRVESADSIYGKFGVDEIMNAIQQLSPVYKAVFNMYVIDGYQHKEIAEQLNISEGTSKSNLSKAKQNLQEILLKRAKTTYDGKF